MPSGPELDDQSSESNPHYPFLLFEGNIGIPQSILYKAYIVASQQLPRLTLNLALDASSMSDHDDLVSATAILLIANPAHNTALNRRKKLIQTCPSKLALDEDIKFVAALFGSKQASKSSLLWHHRRWLFRHKYNTSVTHTGPKDSDPDSLEYTSIPVKDLSSEFELVARACEIYPRNYHAWLHRYLCAQCLVSQVKENVPGALEVLFQELEASHRWIELHVSDYTAAQYLLRLDIIIQSIGVHAPRPLSPHLDAFHSTASISTSYNPITLSALSLVGSYPTHESLWLYLRLAWNALEHQNDIANRWIIDLVLTLNRNNHPEGDWPDPLIQQIYSSCRTEDLPFIRKYASRFLAWTMVLVGMQYPLVCFSLLTLTYDQQQDGLPYDAIPRILTDPELPAIYLAGLCS